MVFNLKGNDCRLVVAINYRHQIVFIKWIGTHGDYDMIEVKMTCPPVFGPVITELPGLLVPLLRSK